MRALLAFAFGQCEHLPLRNSENLQIPAALRSWQKVGLSPGAIADLVLLKLIFGAGTFAAKRGHFVAICARKVAIFVRIPTRSFSAYTVRLSAAAALFCGNNASAAKNLTRGIFDHFSAPISCLFWQNLENLWVTLCEGFGERIDKVSKMFPSVVCSSLVTRHGLLPLATSSPALQSPASPARRRAGVPPIL